MEISKEKFKEIIHKIRIDWLDSPNSDGDEFIDQWIEELFYDPPCRRYRLRVYFNPKVDILRYQPRYVLDYIIERFKIKFNCQDVKGNFVLCEDFEDYIFYAKIDERNLNENDKSYLNSVRYEMYNKKYME